MSYSIPLALLVSVLSLALPRGARADELPLALKSFITLDVKDIEKMVDQNINGSEEDDDIFYNQMAETLAFRILPHPSFTARSAGISRMAMKIQENSEWQEIYERAAHKLITAYTRASTPAEMATAIVGLTHLVTEIRTKKESYKSILETIKGADIKVTKEASDYARDPMRHLVSPSQEAALGLN